MPRYAISDKLEAISLFGAFLSFQPVSLTTRNDPQLTCESFSEVEISHIYIYEKCQSKLFLYISFKTQEQHERIKIQQKRIRLQTAQYLQYYTKWHELVTNLNSWS